MKTGIRTLVGALVFLSVLTDIGPALAGTISLDVTPGSSFRRGRIHVNAAIVNLGDEPAHDITLELRLGASIASTNLTAELGTNGTISGRLDVSADALGPGRHMAALLVHYSDRNGYPFTALSSVPVLTSAIAPDDEPVRASAPDIILKHNEGEIQVRLEATETLDAPVEVAVVPPRGLSVQPASHSVPADSLDLPLRFTVRNTGLFPGSHVPVLLVVSSQRAGETLASAATVTVEIPDDARLRGGARRALTIAVIAALVAFTIVQMRRPAAGGPRGARALALILDAGLLAVLAVFTLYHLHVDLMLTDTMTVGGDTPAHNVLASHMRRTLFGEGRLLSWGSEWWCGFPAFQFYFTLPYVMIALADTALPFNVAFKCVSAGGLVLLPLCAYISARWARLPRPTPILMAMFTLPLLFDNTHTMWGVNAYSTLAGMISNSWSFAIMVLALGRLFRDLDDEKPSPWGVVLLALLIASHFFTSVMAALTLIALPFLRPPSRMLKAFGVLALEGGLAALLMAWWIVPLLLMSDHAVEFGVNWKVYFWRQFPELMRWLVPLVITGIIAAIVLRSRQTLMLLWMGVLACLLFFFGNRLSPVFVNVRLWPFLVYALLMLAAAGAGLVLQHYRQHWLAATALLGILLLHGAPAAPTTRGWARWNFTGLEALPRADVFERLVLPLAGTPGRLANDLHPANQSLGSSRIFEAVPHLTGKPVLEGGLVNSAAGSLFSYYIQGESSQNSAGFPSLVQPASFDFERATRHLKLFNVKHFIARWEGTRAALAASDEWRLLDACQGWELYELQSHDGSHVFVPPFVPHAVRTDRWQEAGLDWLYRDAALPRFVALLSERDDWEANVPWSEDAYEAFLEDPLATAVSWVPLTNEVRITQEQVGDHAIRFRTTGVGLPHIVRCTYYPNWKRTDGGPVYRVTPGFLLVFPSSEEVELRYGYTGANRLGHGLTVLGLLGSLGLIVVTLQARRGGHVVPAAGGGSE